MDATHPNAVAVQTALCAVGAAGEVRILPDAAWAAGGVPHAVFPTSYDELVRITGGMPTRVVP